MPPLAPQKREVVRWCERWRARLLLSHWTIHVEFCDKPCWIENPPDHPESECKASPCQAVVIPRQRYSRMSIWLFPAFWTYSKDERQRTLIHEMTHSLTDRVHDMLLACIASNAVTRREVEDAIENLTEHFSNCLWSRYTPKHHRV